MFWIPGFSKEKMIVVKLQGGLGNQMFQYAVSSILALKSKSNVKIEDSFFENTEKSKGFTPRQFELSVFDNHYQFVTLKEIDCFTKLSKFNQLKKYYGLNYPMVFMEPSLKYDAAVLKLKAPVYLEGYFQSYHYLEGFESFVKDLFSFSTMNLDEKNKNILAEINNTETVSVHIRRGDYVNDKLTQQFHGNCAKEYYLEAIHRMEQKSKGLTYVFFSDDIAWVKEEFADLLVKKIFVDENNGSASWKDMFLMTHCSHNIIANSSFSWWGAWLNSFSEKTVIAPKKWFLNTDANEKTKDLIPESWIRI